MESKRRAWYALASTKHWRALSNCPARLAAWPAAMSALYCCYTCASITPSLRILAIGGGAGGAAAAEDSGLYAAS